jgi:CubicO group peptidase (beta-lactamase class C family)
MRGARFLSRRRFIGLLGAYLASLPAARSAVSRSRQQPLEVGADTGGLRVRTGRVIEVLEHHIETGYLVGAVALISGGGHAEVVAVGEQSLDAPRLMQRDSLFRISSMTQPITAAATLMLIDAGRLRLDQPIDYWLPELAHRRVQRQLTSPLEDTVRARRPITVEDLLTDRCGLGVAPTAGDYPVPRRVADLELPGFGPPDPATPLSPDEWLQRVGALPLMTQPGDTWLYNTGSCILGVLLARMLRKPLPHVLEELIFAPLGMRDTAFVVPPSKRERLVSAYRLEAGRVQLFDDPASSPWMNAPAFPDGSAGLVSTVDDFFAFSHFLLTRGHPVRARLLSDQAVADMTRDHLTAEQRAAAAPFLGNRRGWGFGLAVVTETTPEGIPAGAYGSTGGFGTSWIADPLSATSAILFTQTLFTSYAPPVVHEEFWSAVFSPPIV